MTSKYGTPAQLLAVEYDAGMGPIVLGLYVAPGQYPVGAILTPDGGPVGVRRLRAPIEEPTICESCETSIGQTPAGYIPFVGEPVTTGIGQCVACFASAGVRVWTTEDVEATS